MASGSIQINGLEALLSSLTTFQQDQAPFALMLSLNNIAFKAKSEIVNQMSHVFDSPVPYTLNSFYVKKATKTDLSTRIFFKDPSRLTVSQHYLWPQAKGVQRGYKPYEGKLRSMGIMPSGWFSVPAVGAILDAYGNMSRAQISQIINFFLNVFDSSFLGDSYFCIKPGSSSRLPPGIWQRIYHNTGTQTLPVLLFFPNNTVNYRKRLDVDAIAQQTFSQEFQQEFSTNLDRALATAFR